MKKVKIFSDGCCLGNPGVGGWAYILRFGDKEKILSGAVEQTTNNRMELMGLLSALKALKEPCEVEILTDSSYAVNGINDWHKKWLKNNFKNSDKEEVKNKDLWEEIIKQIQTHKITAIWTKGHAGHTENELCDKMAKKVAKELKDKIENKTKI